MALVRTPDYRATDHQPGARDGRIIRVIT